MQSSLKLFAALAIVLAAAGAGPALAQAPDCTGISDVSSFDGPAISDFDGWLTTVRVASGLLRPVLVTAAPGDTERLFIVEQNGKIKILTGGTVLPDPFLDITSFTRAIGTGGGNEEGLLGLAFHPDYATNGWFFVYHTNTTGSQNVVARYTRDALDPNLADASTRTSVIEVNHPTFSNHNGGMIAFGPDGHLYIGSGDGGSSCDPAANGQNLETNLGALLRLDVDTLPYGTTGNPYDAIAVGSREIWSYGLRNPWRFSFDRETGALYIGDVGQGVWEEINCEPAATGKRNYGWDRYEGLACPNPSCGSQGGCVIRDNTLPVRVYNHNTAGFSCSVTGGYVYRGCRMGDLHGTYFYADYCSDFIRTFTTDGTCAVSAEPDLDRTSDLTPDTGGLSIVSITSFGEDARGELYVVERNGEIFKILPVLSIFEVSGENTAPLRRASADDWRWEDLAAATVHSISGYKVYRSDSGPTGPFLCVQAPSGPEWTGDLEDPPTSGAAYYYLVTATGSGGEETRPGNRSGGSGRTVDTGSVCPG